MTHDTQISDREREILRLVATGATNQQIAHQLNISINTVKVHLRNIFGKIGVVSRTEATVYAIRNGLVPDVAVAAEQFPAESKPPAHLVEDILEEPRPTTEPLSEPTPIPLGPAGVAPASRRALPPLAWLGGGLAAVLVAAALIWFFIGGTSPPTAAPAASVGIPEDSAERWSSHAPLSRPRDGFALAAFEPGGRLFVVGGSEAGRPLAWLDSYDPQTDSWEPRASKLTAVSNAGAIALRGKIYVPGGEETADQPSSVFEVYDPQGDRWDELKPLLQPRSRHALAAWEGRIYLFGGWDGVGPSSDVFVYDLEADDWKSAPSLPSPRLNASATVVAGKIYLVGGEDAAGPLSDVLRLDPGAPGGGRWERLEQLPQQVAHPSAITVINSLLVFDAAGVAAWQYDSGTNEWLPYAIPADAPVAPAGALLNTSIFFVAEAAAPNPGTLGECRVIFTTVFPVRGSP